MQSIHNYRPTNNLVTLMYAFFLAIILHGLVVVAIHALPISQYVPVQKQTMVVVLTPRSAAKTVSSNNKNLPKHLHATKKTTNTQPLTAAAIQGTILHTQQQSQIKAAPPPKSAVTPEMLDNQQLARMRAEIADISAEFDRIFAEHNKPLRRRAINAENAELAYATYLTDWQTKVEFIGNTNYPDDVRRLNLHGDLVLQVTLQADGHVREVRVVHSSGYALLDAAAINIVHLAAPFAPFPAAIRKETDILDITRTWEFLTDNSLSWGD